MGELKRRAHSVGQNSYHLIWNTKYRIKMLKPTPIRKACEGILRMVASQNSIIIHEMELLSDHVHLFAEIPPWMSVSTCFQILKGNSSKILRRNFSWLRKFPSMWTKGKFHRSVGNVTSDVIEHYITKCQGNYDYFDVKRKYDYWQQTRLKSW